MHFCTTFLGDVPRKRYEIANFAFNSLILLEIEKKNEFELQMQWF